MGKQTTAEIVRVIRTTGERDAEPNRRGNEVYRLCCNTGRYIVDFAPDFADEGWQQFDTDQDAAYFGVWVNRRRRLTLSYAEGDWVLVVCPTMDGYRAEVESYCQFYDEGATAIGIEVGPGGPFGTPASRNDRVTVYRQDRRAMFLDPIDAESGRIDDEPEGIAAGDSRYYRTPGVADC